MCHITIGCLESDHGKRLCPPTNRVLAGDGTAHSLNRPQRMRSGARAVSRVPPPRRCICRSAGNRSAPPERCAGPSRPAAASAIGYPLSARTRARRSGWGGDALRRRPANLQTDVEPEYDTTACPLPKACANIGAVDSLGVLWHNGWSNSKPKILTAAGSPAGRRGTMHDGGTIRWRLSKD